MGFQLYLYCSFGNEVTLLVINLSLINSLIFYIFVKASNMSLFIWSADWFDCDASFKNNMIFTMERIKKPVYMTVGKFAPLTLQTFVTVPIGKTFKIL